LNADNLKDENAVLIVNIEETQDYKLLAIKNTFSQLSGRIILQNILKTIEQISSDDKFEYIAHDFFAPQIVKSKSNLFLVYLLLIRRTDAQAYYFRNILYDWSDDDCLTILKNTISAITKNYSFVLINK